MKRAPLHRLRHGVRPAALRTYASGAGHRAWTRSRRAASSGARRIPKSFASRERIRAHLPSMERMRFVTTGTEAMMSAIRVARAFTGRSRVLKFAGNYHGHFDLALLDAGASASGAAGGGIPEGVRARRRRRALQRSRSRRRRDRAESSATSPRSSSSRSPATWGSCRRLPVFSKACASARDAWGALLIFDEVITWLRFGLGGAQGRIGVSAGSDGARQDHGRRRADRRLRRARGRHGGARAGRAARLPAARTPAIRSASRWRIASSICSRRIRSTTRRWTRSRSASPTGFARSLRVAACRMRSCSTNPSSTSSFAPGRRTATTTTRAAPTGAYAAYYDAMLARGILLPPSQNEVMFVSTAHTREDVDETLARDRRIARYQSR